MIRLKDGAEIVRYDRAGKWYYESGSYRRRLTLAEAVQFVTRPSEWMPGKPGGGAFDCRVRGKFNVAE